MNPATCTWINTLTNVIALLPIGMFIKAKDYKGAALCGYSMISSIGMHISETKHQLPGLYFKNYSDILLNNDRFGALALSSYSIYYYFLPNPTSLPAIIFAIGFIALHFGEMTNNLKQYTYWHTIWHLCSYGALAYTIWLTIRHLFN